MNPVEYGIAGGSNVQNSGSISNSIIVYNSGAFDKEHPPHSMIGEMHTGHPGSLQCDPSTRQTILHEITSWAEDTDREDNILLVLGPAGFGKSAIAMATAVKLDEQNSKARVAGSFFFLANDQQRNNPQRFVLTLAYQLAISMEGIGDVKGKILGTIERDSAILQKNAMVQWKRLILEPLGKDVVLDLIDSCGPGFPISFLVTSRPDPNIIERFAGGLLSSCYRIRIDLALRKDPHEMKMLTRSRFLFYFNPLTFGVFSCLIAASPTLFHTVPMITANAAIIPAVASPECPPIATPTVADTQLPVPLTATLRVDESTVLMITNFYLETSTIMAPECGYYATTIQTIGA